MHAFAGGLQGGNHERKRMGPRSLSISDLLLSRRSCRDFSDSPLTGDVLVSILWAAQGITGSEGKRTALSAGALYPLRLFVAMRNVKDFKPGLYHGYDAPSGMLSCIREGNILPALETSALEEQPWVGQASAVIVIAADFTSARQTFAEQPPQGIRGERYIWIEAGATAQNMHLQATDMGLGGVLVAGIDDVATSEALDLDPPWDPVLLFCLGYPCEKL